MCRRLTVFFLWGALLLGGSGAAAALSPPPGPAFSLGPLENPARVALQAARPAGQGSFGFVYYPEPFESRIYLAYAVPDTELGAAQLLFEDRRAAVSDGEESTRALGYAWGRHLSPRLSAGVQLKGVIRQATISGLTLPQESGFGLDAGLLYDYTPNTWLEAAVLDAFGTRLRSGSGTTTVQEQRLFARITRQIRPELALSVAVSDLTADFGEATWVLGARAYRANWTIDGEAGVGPGFVWSFAARQPHGRWALKATAQGTADTAGFGLGVDVQW